MNRLHILTIILSGCFSTTALVIPADATENFSYGKVYTLENDSITIKVAPKVGRIIHFSFKDGENIIWLEDTAKLPQTTNTWRNIGGDKIWPAQQNDWKFVYGGGSWPPQTELDGHQFSVISAGPRKLVMESTEDSRLHVVLRRTITVDGSDPLVTIRNTLIQQKRTPWPVQIWSVTQCPPPSYCLLDISPNAPDRESHPFRNLWDSPLPQTNSLLAGSNTLVFSLSEKCNIGKVGTIGNYCAAVYDNYIFLQLSDSAPDGCYPDGAGIEVFSFDRYSELETLSPARHLAPGETLVSTTCWQLLKKSPADTPQTVIEKIKSLNDLQK